MSVAMLAGPNGAEQKPRQFCTFRLGDQLFGVDIADVKEVNPEITLTRIPQAPPQVLGYVNLRGQIYLVLDLRRLLGLPAGRVGPESRLLIFKASVGDSLAGLVDRIGDIVAVEPGRIEPWAGINLPSPLEGEGVGVRGSGPLALQDPTGLPAAPQHKGELIAGIAQLDAELLILLQAGQFLRVVEEAMDS